MLFQAISHIYDLNNATHKLIKVMQQFVIFGTYKKIIFRFYNFIFK